MRVRTLYIRYILLSQRKTLVAIRTDKELTGLEPTRGKFLNLAACGARHRGQ
jgi:hypothetical protein